MPNQTSRFIPRDVPAEATDQSLRARFIAFTFETKKQRRQTRLKILSKVVWAHLIKKNLLPALCETDARELLEKTILNDPWVTEDNIDTWFTRAEKPPEVIMDLVAFLNQKE